MSTATAGIQPSPAPTAAVLRRKPVGMSAAPPPPPPQILHPAAGPYHQQHPGIQLPVRQPPTHSHARTASSSAASSMGPPHAINPVNYQAYLAHSRRSPSMATVSTLPSSGMPTRKNSSSNNSLERSASSRSGNSSSSYVALMRRQKATVWSDRAQHEDPRILAAQRAAKLRAHMEVSGAASSRGASVQSSSLTGGVARKIRHGHAVKAQQYAPDMVSGVPMRLSAREVDESDSDEDLQSRPRSFHHRTGSGRSSLNSAGGGGARAASMYGLTPRYRDGELASQSSTPPQTAKEAAPPPTIDNRARAGTQGSLWSEGAEPTPVPGKFAGSSDYFAQSKTGTSGTVTSGSEEQEASFGGVSQLPLAQKTDPEQKKLDLAELRRRGSVDERTMTMSGYGRLFVANPDLSD